MMSLKDTVSVDDALDVLNRMLSEDPKAASALMASRVPCNVALASDPTIQVGRVDDDPTNEYEVGPLGLINGLFGTDEYGGVICAELNVVCPSGCSPDGIEATLRPGDECPICWRRLIEGPIVAFRRYQPKGRAAMPREGTNASQL